MYLGIDLGTSGLRGSAIDEHGKELATVRIPLPHLQQPSDWQHAAFNIIAQLCDQVASSLIRAIAIDGTSATVMLCDGNGEPCSPALMYNDQSCSAEAEQLSRIVPEDSAACTCEQVPNRATNMVTRTSRDIDSSIPTTADFCDITAVRHDWPG